MIPCNWSGGFLNHMKPSLIMSTDNSFNVFHRWNPAALVGNGLDTPCRNLGFLVDCSPISINFRETSSMAARMVFPLIENIWPVFNPLLVDYYMALYYPIILGTITMYHNPLWEILLTRRYKGTTQGSHHCPSIFLSNLPRINKRQSTVVICEESLYFVFSFRI